MLDFLVGSTYNEAYSSALRGVHAGSSLTVFRADRLGGQPDVARVACGRYTESMPMRNYGN